MKITGLQGGKEKIWTKKDATADAWGRGKKENWQNSWGVEAAKRGGSGEKGVRLLNKTLAQPCDLISRSRKNEGRKNVGRRGRMTMMQNQKVGGGEKAGAP